MFFCFVFSIAARLIKLPPVTAPGEILPFNWKNKIQLENGPNEFILIFISSSDTNLLRKKSVKQKIKKR